MDLAILGLLLREGYGHSRDMARLLGRPRRTVNHHLSKLDRMGLVERVGSARCPFQWYRVPYYLEPYVSGLCHVGWRLFASNPYRAYLSLPCQATSEIAGARALARLRSLLMPPDPGRPCGRSLPYRSERSKPLFGPRSRLLAVSKALLIDASSYAGQNVGLRRQVPAPPPPIVLGPVVAPLGLFRPGGPLG